MEVEVGQVQPLGAALGNLPGFVEVRPRQLRLALHRPQLRAGEDIAGDVVMLAGAR